MTTHCVACAAIVRTELAKLLADTLWQDCPHNRASLLAAGEVCRYCGEDRAKWRAHVVNTLTAAVVERLGWPWSWEHR